MAFKRWTLLEQIELFALLIERECELAAEALIQFLVHSPSWMCREKLIQSEEYVNHNYIVLFILV